jgi:hypothetical protein
MDLGNGCIVKFRYCYRTACEPNPYQIFIGELYWSDECGDHPDFSEYYKTTMAAALAYVVTVINPWGIGSPGDPLHNIPPCPEQSVTYFRLGHPTCTSERYWRWIDGDLYLATSSCFWSELAGTCWNTFTYCYEVMDDGSFKLIPTETGPDTIGQCVDSIDTDYGTLDCINVCN